MLPQCQQDTCERQGLWTEPNSCFSDLSDSLNSLISQNSCSIWEKPQSFKFMTTILELFIFQPKLRTYSWPCCHISCWELLIKERPGPRWLTAWGTLTYRTNWSPGVQVCFSSKEQMLKYTWRQKKHIVVVKCERTLSINSKTSQINRLYSKLI